MTACGTRWTRVTRGRRQEGGNTRLLARRLAFAALRWVVATVVFTIYFVTQQRGAHDRGTAGHRATVALVRTRLGRSADPRTVRTAPAAAVAR